MLALAGELLPIAAEDEKEEGERKRRRPPRLQMPLLLQPRSSRDVVATPEPAPVDLKPQQKNEEGLEIEDVECDPQQQRRERAGEGAIDGVQAGIPQGSSVGTRWYDGIRSPSRDRED